MYMHVHNYTAFVCNFMLFSWSIAEGWYVGIVIFVHRNDCMHNRKGFGRHREFLSSHTYYIVERELVWDPLLYPFSSVPAAQN